MQERTEREQIRLAVSGNDGAVRIFDPQERQAVGARMAADVDEVTSLEPETRAWKGLQLLVGYGPKLRLWDYQAERVDVLATGHVGSISKVAQVAVKPGQFGVATCGIDGSVRLLTGSNLPSNEVGADVGMGALLALATVPGSIGQVVVAGARGAVLKWDLLAQQRVSAPLREHSGAVLSLAFLNGGRLLASGGQDGRVLFYDVENWSTQKLLHPGHAGWVWSMCAVDVPEAAGGLVSGGSDGMVRFWSQSGYARQLTGHVGQVRSVCQLTNAGRVLLASAGDDGTIRLWDIEEASCVYIIPVGLPVRAIAPLGVPERLLQHTECETALLVGTQEGPLVIALHASFWRP
jgi:WD40 repeat protein